MIETFGPAYITESTVTGRVSSNPVTWAERTRDLDDATAAYRVINMDFANLERRIVGTLGPEQCEGLIQSLRDRGVPGPYTVHLGERVSIDIEASPSHIERIIRSVEDRERRNAVVEYECDAHPRRRPDRTAPTAAQLRASKRRNANKQARVARRRNRK